MRQRSEDKNNAIERFQCFSVAKASNVIFKWVLNKFNILFIMTDFKNPRNYYFRVRFL